MYFPFFYGKQFELLAIRDFSMQVSPDRIYPIIEPVKNNFNSLKLACDALEQKNFNYVVIVNPSCGELKGRDLINQFLDEKYIDSKHCHKGILISRHTSAEKLHLMIQNSKFQCFLIHDEISDEFSEILEILKENNAKITGHIFFRKNISDIKIKKIKDVSKNNQHLVSLQDWFNKVKNADYPSVEFFSDQHFMLSSLFTDFADYSIAGREYSETGGPAYAIAIHLTFFDSNDDDIMKIFHFISDSTESSDDPAGKFLEALKKMMRTIYNPPKGVKFDSLAIQEFKRLYDEKHYPGLGFLKKLSMLHHIQILDQYLKQI